MHASHKRAGVSTLSTRFRKVRFSSTLLTLSLITFPSWASGQSATPQAEQATKSAATQALRPAFTARSLKSQEVTEVALKRGVQLQSGAGASATPRFTSKLPVGPGGKTIYVENVLVESGRVDALIPSNKEAGILLQSKDGVQAISAGGRISMVVGSNHVAVAALDGPVLVGKSGLFKPLAQGTIRTFTASGAVDRQLPTAPSLSSPGLSFAVGTQIPVSLQGGTAAGAKSYCGFLFDEKGEVVSKSCGHSDPRLLTLEAPHAGNFWGAVKGFDEDGFDGPLSQLALIRILGFANPNLETDHGVTLLGPGERAEILGYEGLQMRYGRSPDFVAATRTIGIPGGQATTIEFRDPQRPSESVTVHLSPKLLKSKITIGPGHNVAPSDEIKISVQMWDGEERLINVLKDYKIVTRIGLDEIQVNFTEENGQAVGMLPARQGSGPWVVRVSVINDAGDEVGRNFLEIEKPTSKTAARGTSRVR